MSEAPPPPCENYPMKGQHPRFPSGDCVVCGALCTQGCKHENWKAWAEQEGIRSEE